jgi:hypothetical protein
MMNTKDKPTLQGRTIILRPIAKEDAAAMLEYGFTTLELHRIDSASL